MIILLEWIWRILITASIIVLTITVIIIGVHNLKRDTQQIEMIMTNQKAIMELQKVTIKLTELQLKK